MFVEDKKANSKLVFIAGHQPHYLPWIGYFSKIYQSDKFVLVDSIQFNKHYFQHRSRIKISSGELMLTVPVHTHGRYYQRICDVEIDNSRNWRDKHWKSIQLAYQKAEYFSEYAYFFERTYTQHWDKLVDLNEHILCGMFNFFGIQKDIVRSSTFMPQGQKTDLLIDICRNMHADGYLSGTGGAKQYVDEQKFQEAGLEHRFQSFTHPIYTQLHGAFIPKMSAIDLLFNCGPDSRRLIIEAGRA